MAVIRGFRQNLHPSMVFLHIYEQNCFKQSAQWLGTEPRFFNAVFKQFQLCDHLKLLSK